jgi:SAM-dependent methyltransferase
MKIENKDFWEKEDVIATQRLKNASDFEIFMFEKAKERYESTGKIQNVKIFGCGAGREVEAIAKYFSPNKIVASDISKNMISRCITNLKLWNIDQITDTVVINAVDYNENSSEFELVTILNSMLTYVPNKNDRITIFKNSNKILKPNGVLIGTVHNQVGTLAKTLYFKFRSLFSIILGDHVGNRMTGFKGFKVSGYYYIRTGLHQDLVLAGFKNIEIYSLEEYASLFEKKYNRKKGYNNLIFIASK